MAKRTKIVGDQFLKFIYNVSQQVGPGKANLAEDVELVQFLLAASISNPSAERGLRIRFPAPPRNGTFDLVTGFWIYEHQFVIARKTHSIIDGVVSPAREGTNGTYGGGKMWTIFALNRSLKVNTPEIFDTLPDNPNLSKRLRDQLRPTAARV